MDPKTKTAMTLYYQRTGLGQPGSTTQLVPTGPPTRLMGSELKSIYSAPKPYVATRKIGNDYYFSVKGNSLGASQQQQGRQLRAYQSSLPSEEEGEHTKKIVYWDGMSHHIINAPANTTLSKDWKPPHLHHTDLEDGHILGVRETPGAEKIRLVGSKYRYLPKLEPGGPSPCALRSPWEDKCGTGMYGTGSYGPSYTTDYSGRRGSSAKFNRPGGNESFGASTAARPQTAAAADGYGCAGRPLTGQPAFESTAKTLNGVGGWERTQQYLGASGSINGRPSHVRSPTQPPKVAFE